MVLYLGLCLGLAVALPVDNAQREYQCITLVSSDNTCFKVIRDSRQCESVQRVVF